MIDSKQNEPIFISSEMVDKALDEVSIIPMGVQIKTPYREIVPLQFAPYELKLRPDPPFMWLYRAVRNCCIAVGYIDEKGNRKKDYNK
jgi:hypothetical protein